MSRFSPQGLLDLFYQENINFDPPDLHCKYFRFRDKGIKGKGYEDRPAPFYTQISALPGSFSQIERRLNVKDNLDQEAICSRLNHHITVGDSFDFAVNGRPVSALFSCKKA